MGRFSDRLRSAGRAVGEGVPLRLRRLRSKRAEILAALALLVGWTLVTWGVASLVVWQVWPISVGLFLLSVFGWRMFWTMATEGLYSLTRGDG